MLEAGATTADFVEVEEEGEGGRSDACRGWVLLAVLGKLAAEAKVDVAQFVQVGVVGPHFGKDLDNQAKVLLNQTLAGIASLCCQETSLDAVGEDLEDMYGVGNAGKFGADAKPGGELAPLLPGCLVGADAGVQKPL